MASRGARGCAGQPVKLLVDMNLSPNWIAHMKSAGLSAVHWSEVGRADAPDSEIMAYAAEHDFVVVTHDLDFGAILATTLGPSPAWYKFVLTI
jgi:predicted nuclease of predicted toxin-antitoxin system